MGEFQLIRHYFSGLTASREGVVLGIGDDAALLEVSAGWQLVVTTDTLVAGRHFPLATRPFDIGWKSLAVNLSDIAAMGAVPRWFTLALTVPEQNEDWLAGFSEGLRTLAEAHGIALVGGDTTRGPLSITITAMGLVEAGRAMRRDGAIEGDAVCVTGTLGDAALALRGDATTSPDDSLRRRLDRPTPRVEAGLRLAEWATSAIDVSDGLAGDLQHVLLASELGATLHAESLPRSPAFLRAAPGADALVLQLHGGDDYELCVTMKHEDLPAAQAALKAIGVPLTVIGTITAEPGLRLREAGGIRSIKARGYDHFQTP